MNHLIAKVIKDRKIEFLKVLGTRTNIFDSPDYSDNVEYSPSYKLEDNQWFTLNSFLQRNYENGLIEGVFSSTRFNQIEKKHYPNIKFLCSKQGKFFLFQKMSSTRFLEKKWFYISGEPALQVNKPIIVLESYVDAVYDVSADVLYFKDLARIKTMFKGIDELYREATQVEVNAFFTNDFISSTEEYSPEKVKTANRKRIAAAMDTFTNFTSKDKRTIFKYIRSYYPNLSVGRDQHSFIVDSEENLKQVLFGIEQRYYTTKVGSEKRLANSVLSIDT